MDKWDKRFMEMTEQIGKWSSCYQENRHVGAVIVKNKRIIATGYNGAPQGIKSCADKKECLRKQLGIESGTRHETCYAVHAEQNAIIQAARVGCSVEGCTLYCTHQPCVICAKIIINSGISRVVFKEGRLRLRVATIQIIIPKQETTLCKIPLLPLKWRTEV